MIRRLPSSSKTASLERIDFKLTELVLQVGAAMSFAAYQIPREEFPRKRNKIFMKSSHERQFHDGKYFLSLKSNKHNS